MSGLFHRGLVVGKFAPLHHGHELVIAHALVRCDEVVLISYCKPEPPGCGPERRARWLEARFPHARRLVATDALVAALGDPEWTALPPDDAPADVHRRFVAFLCRRALDVEVDAVFTSESYGDGFARVLTAEQRRRRPGAPAVRHVPVDAARGTVPVSGRDIRADVHAHRERLSPVVYATFVKRVCLLGGESSGKSTLAARLAESLGTVHVPEYGRELWERRGGALAFDDLLRIAERQVALEEDAAGRAREWLVCDTSPLTTLLYSRHLFGRADPALERLAATRRYDLSVLCAPDFAFVQDGTRQDAAFRQRQHDWYVTELAARGDRWLLAAGDVASRLRTVREWLSGHGRERQRGGDGFPARP